MIARKFLGIATIITSFNDEYDIIHQFRNLDGGSLLENNPVEYHTVSLKNKETGVGVYVARASDEASPCNVNGYYIGGNHGQPSAVFVYSPKHGKTIRDVGAIYTDDEGTKFTLVRVQNDDYLLLISENIGKNENDYAFKQRVVGKLKFISDGENKSDIIVSEQTERSYLSSALRHKRRKLVGYINDVPKTIENSLECDYAEIIEEYDIINPATVAPALTAERPKDGYTRTIHLGDFGKPMINHKMIYRVMPDGAVVCDFELTKLSDVNLTRFMSIMHQGFTAPEGGKKFRYIPKLKIFTTPEGTFDFSSPYPLADAPFPYHVNPGKEYNENPDYPTERFVDYSIDDNGKYGLAFAMGFLPVFDGAPEIRKNVNSAIFIYQSRKGYPTFMDGNFSHARGISYKKYFYPKDNASVYAIEYDNKKYIYFDFFKENTLSYPIKGKVTSFEIKDAEYKIENGNLTVSANKGFAVFIEE